MASTALSLHLRRNTLSKNPNSVKLFSSSSSFPPPPPPQNDTDETTPSNHSQSQSQSSFSSYFKDLKSNLKQPQQPFQQTQQPPSQFQQTFQRSPNQFQQTPPTKAASFDEIRKNLSELDEIRKNISEFDEIRKNMGSNNNVLVGFKLRNIEEKESEADTKVYPYKGLRETLQELASDKYDKKKSSEEKESEADTKVYPYKGLRETLQELASDKYDKKKSSVSCREADKAEIKRRLREKNAALNVRKKKEKVIKPTESSSAMPKTPQEVVPNGSSVNVKRHHITTNDAVVIYDEPVNKKIEDDDISFVRSPPENSIVVASAASVTFGQNASSLLVSSEDQDTLVRFTGSACGNQSVAHITQALKWASAQVAKTELYERQITELEKEVADAKKRATEHLMKLSNVENKADEAKKKLKVAEDEITSLKNILIDQSEYLRIANDVKAEAQSLRR